MVEQAVGKRGMRKARQGRVVSKSGVKTVVVLVERRKRHETYSKVMKLFKKYHAHDESDAAKVGDVVVIEETRPMSRLKRWRVVQVIGAAQ